MAVDICCTIAEKFCRRRDAPLNGNQSPDKVKYRSGAKVDYFCNKNYKLEGSPIAICVPNGEWSHPVPTCKGINLISYFTIQRTKYRNRLRVKKKIKSPDLIFVTTF